MPLANGDVFAGFQILRPLGFGGMGEVYLVQHPRLPRHDALKILPAEMSADPEFRARFNREAEMAAGLYHPHIVGIHDRGEFNGQLWISMDFIDGPDAGRLLRDQYPNGMPPWEVVDIVSAVADALAGFPLSEEQEDYLAAVALFLEEYEGDGAPRISGRQLLRQLCAENELSGADLSRILGASRLLGSMLLRGDRNITAEHARTLGKHFKLDPGALL
jgi:antitoxin component HigA of HigAB toxin-antitoxin module